MAVTRSPDVIQKIGIVHPEVAKAARAVMRDGWRVSSIFRPGCRSEHAQGRALDIAPLVYTKGGFGQRTAKYWLDFLSREVPTSRWSVISEDDHVHIQLSPRNVSGVYTPEGIIMNDYYENGAPEFPIGDPNAIHIGETEFYPQAEEGSAMPMPLVNRNAAFARVARMMPRVMPASNAMLNTLNPVAMSRQTTPAVNAAQRGLMLGHVAPVANLRNAAPQLANLASQRVAIRSAAQPNDVLFVNPGSGVKEFYAGAVAATAKLRPADCRSVASFTSANPAYVPQPFAFTVVGANFELDLDTALASTGLPIGVVFNWFGDMLRITSQLLNQQPLDIVVKKVVNGTIYAYSFLLAASTNLSTINIVNGTTVSGVARLVNGGVTVAAAPSGNNRIIVEGLNVNNYSVSTRLYVPGDATADRFLNLIG